MKECMISKKKLGDINDFRTLDGGSLSAEDYRRVSYHYRKGVFTTEEALKVLEMMEEEKSKRDEQFLILSKIGKKQGWTHKEFKNKLNHWLDHFANEKYRKNGCQFLNARERTETIIESTKKLKEEYGYPKKLSVSGAPYSKIITQYNKDINPDVAFSTICCYDHTETMDRLIKVQGWY